MRALIFDGHLRFVKDYPMPKLKPGWAIIRVTQAGICNTDLELTKGYMGFTGILGHEFVGMVHSCDVRPWLGQRVVGEINVACGSCPFCEKGLGRHCQNRSVLGIQNLDGCIADFCTLPLSNLQRVPDPLSDSRAIFTEPVSAAFEILEQIKPEGTERCIVLGDGKIGILCAWALASVCTDVTLVGHHTHKLQAAAWRAIRAVWGTGEVTPGADIVVEATGTQEGFTEAVSLCRPRGTVVLKSTVAESEPLNLAPVVINELNVIGSRCGPFDVGLHALMTYDFPLERLIKGRYPIEESEAAFAHAARPDTLKILIDMST